MKILQVSPLFPPFIGGIEVHVKELSSELVKRGHEVDVATTTQEVESGGDAVEFAIFRFKALSPRNEYHFSPSMTHFIYANADHYDLIHCHNYHALPALQTLLASRGTPVVMTAHYCGRAHNYKAVLHRVYQVLMNPGLKRAQKIISVCQAERDAFCSVYPFLRSRSEVIPNGVDDDLLTCPPTAARRGEAEVLCVSRLEQFKRVDRTMRAMVYLPAHNLTVIGDGPARNELVALSRTLGLENRVTWLGHQDRAEVIAAFRRASVFVTQSSAEAFGMTVVEAAAAGCPVVASDIPSHAELAQAAEGVCLSPFDIHAEGLAALIRSAEGSTARLRNPEFFRWSEIAAATERVYMNVVSAAKA